MSTFSPSEPPFDNELSHAYWLVSRDLDEPLSLEESNQLRRLEGLYSHQIEAFRRDCGQLRAALNALPMKPVGKSLFMVPGTHASAMPVVVDPLPVVVRRTRSGAQRLVVGVVTSALCGILVLAWNRAQDDTSSAPAMVQMSSSESAERLGLDRALSLDVADGMPAAGLSDAGHLSKPSAMTAAPALVKSDVETDADNTSIAPLIQSDNWNVVVVKVEGRDRDMTMDRIQAIVQEHGLRLQKSAGHDQSEWLGVVLTSAMEQSSEVLTAMERDLGESTPFAAESQLDASRSSEIIAAVRESLRYPTRSELHHGRIFVALPTQQEAELSLTAKVGMAAAPNVKDGPERADESLLLPTTDSTLKLNELADSVPEKRSAGVNIDSVHHAKSAPALVTLVVFEFH